MAWSEEERRCDGEVPEGRRLLFAVATAGPVRTSYQVDVGEGRLDQRVRWMELMWIPDGILGPQRDSSLPSFFAQPCPPSSP